MTTKSFYEEVETKLSNKPFVSLSDLVRLGLFGSSAAACAALKRGVLPSMKVTNRRIVVSRQAVLDFVKEKSKG